jgi:glutaredoxin 3
MDRSLQPAHGMADVRIYTTPFCGYCTHAKRLLERKGVRYEEIDVAGDFALRRWLAQTSGQRTVPQIFIDGRCYGGYTDIAALDRQGQLDRVLGLDAA